MNTATHRLEIVSQATGHKYLIGHYADGREASIAREFWQGFFGQPGVAVRIVPHVEYGALVRTLRQIGNRLPRETARQLGEQLANWGLDNVDLGDVGHEPLIPKGRRGPPACRL